MKKENKVLIGISNIIGQFLISNGGFHNGYNTYAKGSVKLNSTGCVEVNLNNDDLTINELKNLGITLETNIKKFMIKNDFKKDIIISTFSREHGVYETVVSFEESFRVHLPFKKRK